MLARIQEENPKDVRIVYRDFPLMSIHDKAAISTQAALAASEQGKFWEMHELLFERQGDWAQMTVEEFQKWAIEQAGELGLDTAQFEATMNSPESAAFAQAAWDKGVQAGMPGTPFLLFNGRIYDGPMSYGNLSTIVKMVLLEKRQYTTCPPMKIDPAKQYQATIKTEKGDIVVELFPDKAPLAVNSFIFLAREGWFDDITFHRVIPDYIAQAGDPSGTGYGGPGYAFDNEIVPGLQFDREGLLAMANAGAGSNGSQFFITMAPTPNLNGGYTIFGQVISGMDVVKNLTPRNPEESMTLPEGDQILTVTVEEK